MKPFSLPSTIGDRLPSGSRSLGGGSDPERRRLSPVPAWCWLIVWGVGGLLTWGVFLPYLSRATGIDRRVQDLERQGVNPSALFYSDHARTLFDPPPSVTKAP
jgi:hypothetical protein